MTSNRSSGAYNNYIGTAISKRDSWTELPSQRPEARRRSSQPVADAYADLVGQRKADEMLAGRRAGDRSSVGVYNDGSKRNSRIFEDQFTLGDVGAIKQRVDRESPIVAELKTNVIVCASVDHVRFDLH